MALSSATGSRWRRFLEKSIAPHSKDPINQSINQAVVSVAMTRQEHRVANERTSPVAKTWRLEAATCPVYSHEGRLAALVPDAYRVHRD